MTGTPTKSYIRLAPKKVRGQLKSILETAKESGGFLTLVKMIRAADLGSVLEGDETFTLFAPTDHAIERLPPGVLDDLMEDGETLTSILQYHLVKGMWRIEDIAAQNSLVTLGGDPISIGSGPFGPSLNDSMIVTPDIECSNGIIQVIDYVLFPCIVKVRGGF